MKFSNLFILFTVPHNIMTYKQQNVIDKSVFDGCTSVHRSDHYVVTYNPSIEESSEAFRRLLSLVQSENTRCCALTLNDETLSNSDRSKVDEELETLVAEDISNYTSIVVEIDKRPHYSESSYCISYHVRGEQLAPEDSDIAPFPVSKKLKFKFWNPGED